MIAKPFDVVEKEDIERLVTDKVQESRTLDYKQELPGNADTDKKEFLADVSSFANSAGGWLIYGVQEKRDNGKTTGLPEGASGLEGITGDVERQRLESIVQSGIEPRIAGVRIKPIAGFPKGPIIVVYIPKSWNSPHMVSFQRTSKFYARNDGGKRQLDLGEIRSAFALSETLPEKVKRFREDRIANILADETPVALAGKHRVVLHMVPLESMTSAASIDLKQAQKNHAYLPPIGSTGYIGSRHNFDGLVTYDHESYFQLFRNGAAESVNACLLMVDKLIPNPFEPSLIDAVDRYLKLQVDLGLSLPIIVMLTLIDVKGYSTQTLQGSLMRGLGTPKGSIDREILALPDLMIEDNAQSADAILRPAFDIVWQACGYPACPNYDQSGQRKN